MNSTKKIIEYNRDRHKYLLKRSEKLEKQGKDIWIENQEEGFELTGYNIAIDDHIFWTRKKDFLLLMEKLINNVIDFEEFETAFTILHRKTSYDSDSLKLDWKRIEKIELNSRSDGFESFITGIFRKFEEIEDEYSTEQDVKNFVKEVYFKIQNSEE